MVHGRIAAILLVAVLPAVILVTGGNLRSAEPVEPLRPDATGLWKQLQEKEYRKNWELWPGKGEKYEGTEPHGRLLTTYLNPPAARAVEQRAGQMPAGAVIVKENYMPDGELDAVTTMHKVQGFNPEHGDWYFAKFDPSGKAQQQGKVEGCIACHSTVSGNDYIFTGPLR